MAPYIFRRVRDSILVLWGVATLLFCLYHLRSHPLQGRAAGTSGIAPVLAKGPVRPVQTPVWTSYGLYLNDLLPIGLTRTNKWVDAPPGIHLTRVDDSSYLSLKAPYLGRSAATNRLVSAVLWSALPSTLLIVLMALLLALFVGVSLGLTAALRNGSLLDRSIVAGGIVGYAIPALFAALVIACITPLGLSHLQRPGLTTSSVFPDWYMPQPNLILPALALSIRPMAMVMQHTRQAMLRILEEEYILAAYARGLSPTRVVLVHALPAALGALAKNASSFLMEILAGTLFVELIFGINGIGKTAADALAVADFPMAWGATLLIAFLFILLKLLADLLYALIVPAARL